MSKINEFAAMQVFTQVVKAGSFSGAARDLGSTPSGVSRQISQLEDELGSLLFQRTTRSQRLTEAGQLYFRHAEKMLTEMAVTKYMLNQLSSRPSGDIRMSVERLNPEMAIGFVVNKSVHNDTDGSGYYGYYYSERND